MSADFGVCPQIWVCVPCVSPDFGVCSILVGVPGICVCPRFLVGVPKILPEDPNPGPSNPGPPCLGPPCSGPPCPRPPPWTPSPWTIQNYAFFFFSRLFFFFFHFFHFSSSSWICVGGLGVFNTKSHATHTFLWTSCETPAALSGRPELHKMSEEFRI